MWQVLERAEMDALVLSVLSICHITMLLDDLTKYLGWHLLFACVDKACLSPSIAEATALCLLPFACFSLKLVGCEDGRFAM